MRRNLSDEARAAMSAGAKARMADPVARAKLAAANRGENNPMFGRKHSEEALARIRTYTHSPEARAKMSAARKGCKASPETRAKLSAVLKGKKRSAETRARMSAAIKASWARRKKERENDGAE